MLTALGVYGRPWGTEACELPTDAVKRLYGTAKVWATAWDDMFRAPLLDPFPLSRLPLRTVFATEFRIEIPYVCVFDPCESKHRLPVTRLLAQLPEFW